VRALARFKTTEDGDVVIESMTENRLTGTHSNLKPTQPAPTPQQRPGKGEGEHNGAIKQLTA
jgi:hypothetical protein